MIKVKVIEDFTLKDFNKLKNIVRTKQNVEGSLFKDDIFECDEAMAKYLTGDNALNKVVVEVIEVEPVKEDAEPKEIEKVKEEPKVEKKSKKKKNK